jgi:NTE family protein
MASGALPPGLPPIEIDGCLWWDGGLVSNTPLDHVLAEERARDLAIFQVDLFPARGPRPASIAEAEERAADIRFSSRTRLVTDTARSRNAERRAIARLIERLPPDLADSAEAQLLRGLARPGRAIIGQLIYRDRAWQGSAKGREFSRATMLSHWQSGVDDARTAIATVESAAIDWRRGPLPEGISSFDLSAPA